LGCGGRCPAASALPCELALGRLRAIRHHLGLDARFVLVRRQPMATRTGPNALGIGQACRCVYQAGQDDPKSGLRSGRQLSSEVGNLKSLSLGRLAGEHRFAQQARVAALSALEEVCSVPSLEVVVSSSPFNVIVACISDQPVRSSVTDQRVVALARLHDLDGADGLSSPASLAVLARRSTVSGGVARHQSSGGRLRFTRPRTGLRAAPLLLDRLALAATRRKATSLMLEPF
jgi:hypothetical protein